MLAETGDSAFRLGHVNDDNYKSLVLSDKLIEAISSSLTQCAPECSTCVFESHCGADPVHHHATQGDALGIKPLSAFCARQKGVRASCWIFWRTRLRTRLFYADGLAHDVTAIRHSHPLRWA
jgi:hypothetical protein